MRFLGKFFSGKKHDTLQDLLCGKGTSSSEVYAVITSFVNSGLSDSWLDQSQDETLPYCLRIFKSEFRITSLLCILDGLFVQGCMKKVP